MSLRLVVGQNCPVPHEELHVVVTAGGTADVSCFRLYGDGKTRQDEDFIFYGQVVNEDNTICFSPKGQASAFQVNLQRMRNDAEKIAFTITTDTADITSLGYINLEIFHSGTSLLSCDVDLASRKEVALILGELYKRNNAWKFRFVGQGFNGGLKPLAEFYGVDIADDAAKSAPPAPAAPAPAPTINLSKVTLTKEKPRIDLKKNADTAGLFKVNLNWQKKNADTTQGRGLLSSWLGGKSGEIDLDLAAFVCLQDGYKTIIQALGDNFGSLNSEPYVKLLGDDRTGAQSEGEWLHINGKNFDEIEEIIIFTFIYDGVPNWAATDAVVTLYIPGQPEVETRLSEEGSKLPMCAIARISNYHGDIRVERINRYFRGHKEMDKAFGWGFSWVAGSK